MPHSPFHQVVYPAIHNLDDYRGVLQKWRVAWDNDDSLYKEPHSMMETVEELITHCDFLDAKLDIKKNECKALKKKIEVLEIQAADQRSEIATLKKEPEKMAAAADGNGTVSSPAQDQASSGTRKRELEIDSEADLPFRKRCIGSSGA